MLLNVLLAFLLYKNLSFGDIVRLRPYLPVDTRRGLAAVEAYQNADPSPPCTDINALADSFQGSNFPFLLLKLLNMRSHPAKDGLLDLIKCILPPDIASSIPDPEMLMSMMELFKSMSFDADTEPQEDKCEDDKKNEGGLNDGQLSFLRKIIEK